jgi:NAD(P)-dependent dehydrogenase (short-subunit alcohol dehydrogenase family)
MGQLTGKRVVVTSADDFMGPAIVKVFREEGAEVIADVSDLRDPAAPQRVIDAAGRIDVLVANLCEKKWFESFAHEMPDDSWLGYFDDMVHPLMRLTRAVLPQMIKRKAGKIVAMNSAAPIRGIPKLTAYCTARGAQNAFIRGAGLEVARHNVQVNAIAQNYVENPAYYPPEMIANADLMKRMLGVLPAKRLGRGEESAWLAAFLASDRADFIVAQVIPFAGGWVTTTG